MVVLQNHEIGLVDGLCFLRALDDADIGITQWQARRQNTQSVDLARFDTRELLGVPANLVIVVVIIELKALASDAFSARVTRQQRLLARVVDDLADLEREIFLE